MCKEVLTLDRTMGTELHKKGLTAGASPEVRRLANPTAVLELHLTNVRETNHLLTEIAVKAVSKELVAGDIARPAILSSLSAMSLSKSP